MVKVALTKFSTRTKIPDGDGSRPAETVRAAATALYNEDRECATALPLMIRKTGGMK